MDCNECPIRPQTEPNKQELIQLREGLQVHPWALAQRTSAGAQQAQLARKKAASKHFPRAMERGWPTRGFSPDSLCGPSPRSKSEKQRPSQLLHGFSRLLGGSSIHLRIKPWSPAGRLLYQPREAWVDGCPPPAVFQPRSETGSHCIARWTTTG